MLVPWGFESFSEALRAGTEVYHCLKGVLKKAGLATDFWHPDLELRRYSATHWSESELAG